MDLAVNIGGIPHLAKNERDVGHPAFVWEPRGRHEACVVTCAGSKYNKRPQLSQFSSVPSRTWFQNCGRNCIWQERQRCPAARARAVLREEEAMRSYWESRASFTFLRKAARSFWIEASSC